MWKYMCHILLQKLTISPVGLQALKAFLLLLLWAFSVL